MLAHFFEGCAFTEAGDVGVGTLTPTLSHRGRGGICPHPALSQREREFTAPGVVGVGDAGEVFIGQFAVGAVDHAAQFAGVYEEDFLSFDPGACRLCGRGQETTDRRGSGSSRRVGRAARPCSPRGQFSIRFFLISPSPDWFDDIEPLASTKPATPLGAR